MRLYLVQHGDAVPKDVDSDRPLSDGGRADIERLTEWLSIHNAQIAQILHSGKTRAKQTAEILRPLLKSHKQIYKGQGLAPNDSPEAFLHQLRDAMAGVSRNYRVSVIVSRRKTDATLSRSAWRCCAERRRL